MKKYFLSCLILFFLSGVVLADTPEIALDKAPIDKSDMASVKRGAKFFAANCMVCHTLVYLRYNQVAIDAGITYEKMPINVKSWPFGVTPPDLSLEADARGVDWIYTYLHSFYVDTTRPTGFNNLLVPDSAMPGIVAAYQGSQMLSTDLKLSQHVYLGSPQWYDVLTLQTHGIMPPQQFDATIADVVNFLGYAAEPFYHDQIHLGFWVIGFLLVFYVLTRRLKKAYWQDVKKMSKKTK